MNYIVNYVLKSSDELENLWGGVGIITSLLLVTEGLGYPCFCTIFITTDQVAICLQKIGKHILDCLNYHSSQLSRCVLNVQMTPKYPYYL